MPGLSTPHYVVLIGNDQRPAKKALGWTPFAVLWKVFSAAQLLTAFWCWAITFPNLDLLKADDPNICETGFYGPLLITSIILLIIWTALPFLIAYKMYSKKKANEEEQNIDEAP